MKIKLSWTDTKDHLIFNCINEDICEWFVQKSQEFNSKFNISGMVTDIPVRSDDTLKRISEISADIDRVNDFLPTLNQPTITKPTDWYDQKQLNNLHKEWAQTNFRVPKIAELLFKLDRTLFDAYQETNCHIHLIENSFQYTFRDNNHHWRLKNPFKDKFYDWHESHLFLLYPGHGREAFEKFLNLDNDRFDDDWCNWDNIDSFIGIKLNRPYKLEPPKEFLDWCKLQNNMIPHRSTLPLANLEDWETNLSRARKLFIENNQIVDNYFILEII